VGHFGHTTTRLPSDYAEPLTRRADASFWLCSDISTRYTYRTMSGDFGLTSGVDVAQERGDALPAPHVFMTQVGAAED
jgi:hypothetical protein